MGKRKSWRGKRPPTRYLRINYHEDDPLAPEFAVIKRTEKAILIKNEFGRSSWFPLYMIDRSSGVWFVEERFHDNLSLEQKNVLQE